MGIEKYLEPLQMFQGNKSNMVESDRDACFLKPPLPSFGPVSAAFGSLSNQFVVFSWTMQMTLFLLFLCFHVFLASFFI